MNIIVFVFFNSRVHNQVVQTTADTFKIPF